MYVLWVAATAWGVLCQNVVSSEERDNEQMMKTRDLPLGSIKTHNSMWPFIFKIPCHGPDSWSRGRAVLITPCCKVRRFMALIKTHSPDCAPIVPVCINRDGMRPSYYIPSYSIYTNAPLPLKLIWSVIFHWHAIPLSTEISKNHSR